MAIKLLLEFEDPEDVQKLQRLFMEGKLKDLGITDMDVLPEPLEPIGDDVLGEDQ